MKSKPVGMALAIIPTLLLLGCPSPVTAPPKSTNADLSALRVSSGTLSPAFAPATTAYTVSVPHTATSITVTGTRADPNATISANNGAAQSLEVGTNTITITVTAQDGITVKNYVVTVTRAEATGASNADLSALTVSSGTLSPAFAPATTAYTVSVPHGTTSITVTGTRADPNATISTNNGVAQNLNVGSNPITITVTAQDGITVKNYVVTVWRWGTDITSATIGTLKYVPAGRFQRDFMTTNISVVSAFRMSQHEITRSQFQAIMGADPSNAARSSGTNDPVQMVTWYHAIAFCNKLSLAEGLTPVYSVTVGGTPVNWSTLTYTSIPTSSNADWNAATANWAANGYRLPTEMEWMWAAMGAPADGQGGGTNTTGYLKAFAGSTGSNAIGDYAVFGFGGSEPGHTTTERTNPVGSKLPNELGLYDMSGNVWEWCWDRVGIYPTGTLIDYRGAASDSGRVNRGGSWVNVASVCTVAGRNGNSPSYQDDNIGFRVVRP